MITLIKLGGSLITDKNVPRHFRQDSVQQICRDIKQMLECDAGKSQFILGHGSGSFGHIEAKKYNTINGVASPQDWLGFTKVAQAASELSQLVLTKFTEANLPIMRFQPSASIFAKSGIVDSMSITPLAYALQQQLIPLIHGDVAFDTNRNGTIVSTETIFSYLVQNLDVTRIILLGEVDGVLDDTGNVIHTITPQSIEQIKPVLKGSSGVDVTGGMYQKVMDMLQLIEVKPDLEIIIANGNTSGILTSIVCHNRFVGTKISAN